MLTPNNSQGHYRGDVDGHIQKLVVVERQDRYNSGSRRTYAAMDFRMQAEVCPPYLVEYDSRQKYAGMLSSFIFLLLHYR